MVCSWQPSSGSKTMVRYELFTPPTFFPSSQHSINHLQVRLKPQTHNNLKEAVATVMSTTPLRLNWYCSALTFNLNPMSTEALSPQAQLHYQMVKINSPILKLSLKSISTRFIVHSNLLKPSLTCPCICRFTPLSSYHCSILDHLPILTTLNSSVSSLYRENAFITTRGARRKKQVRKIVNLTLRQKCSHMIEWECPLKFLARNLALAWHSITYLTAQGTTNPTE